MIKNPKIHFLSKNFSRSLFLFLEMKRQWWISLLLQSVLGVVPVIRYKVTDGTKEDSYIGNIGMVTRSKTTRQDGFGGNWHFWPEICQFLKSFMQFLNADFSLEIPFLV